MKHAEEARRTVGSSDEEMDDENEEELDDGNEEEAQEMTGVKTRGSTKSNPASGGMKGKEQIEKLKTKSKKVKEGVDEENEEEGVSTRSQCVFTPASNFYLLLIEAQD